VTFSLKLKLTALLLLCHIFTDQIGRQGKRLTLTSSLIVFVMFHHLAVQH